MWGESEEAYNQAYDRHEGKLSHELIAGGAAFAGFKVFEDRQRAEGKQVSHAFAKEVLAGLVGAEVDKLVETKGEDWVDRERAHYDARQRAETLYDDHYQGYHNAEYYDPNQYAPPEPMTRHHHKHYDDDW